MEQKNTFRRNLAARRRELGLTQEQLAKRMNVSPQAVSKWENSSYPDTELLPALAAALGTSLDALFGVRREDDAADLDKLLHDTIRSTAPDKRPELLMRLFYTAVCAHDANADNPGRLRGSFERETYSGLKSDAAVALARLNHDLRYFFYLENPGEGVNHYFTNTRNMCRLLRTLADEDCIRIISYLGSGPRNKMHAVSVISERLSLPEEKVQYIIDRLDRFGLVWRMSADLAQGETIMYGYAHNQAVTMILALTQSICNYLEFWDPLHDDFTEGSFRDPSGHTQNAIPQVSWWSDDDP